jgi:CheY-like chemotaxis protein
VDNKSILIVDDEEDVISAIKFRMTMTGCEVLTAGNGAEALEILRDHKIDLILADFMMPEVNGLELTRLVKSHPAWFETKILLFSCNTDPQYRQRAMELGAVDYISKGAGANAIVKRVYELLSLNATPVSEPTAHVSVPDFQQQLHSLARSLADVLHLASLPPDLPEGTRYALNSARRVADDIESLTRTAGSEVEDRPVDRTPVTRSE